MKTKIIEAINKYYGDDAKDAKIFDGNRLTLLGLSMLKEMARDPENSDMVSLSEVMANSMKIHTYGNAELRPDILSTFTIYFNAHPRGDALLIQPNLGGLLSLLTAETAEYRKREALLGYCLGKSNNQLN